MKKRSKTLEKLARTVKDDDEFVEHICNIARGFAAHHALDTGAGARGVRRSLKTFEKHAAALSEWLSAASKRGTPEQEALGSILPLLQNLGVAYVDPKTTRAWLQHATRAAKKAERSLEGKKLSNAPRFAATALRATFEHHKLKVSTQASEKKQSDAVKLFCAIAKSGGDSTLTPMQASEWLKESGKPQRSV